MARFSGAHLTSTVVVVLQADIAQAEFFIAAGIPFLAADNPLYLKHLEAYHRARLYADNYQPAKRRDIAGELLDDIYSNKMDFVANRLKAAASSTKATLATDGLTHLRRPSNNMVAITASAGAMVLDIEDCTDIMVDGTKSAR